MTRAHRYFILFAIVWSALANASAGQTTAPATDPAGVAPREAVKAFRAALEANDAHALAEMTWATDDSRRKLADACARVIVAGKRVADAAAERFGRGGAGAGEPITRGGLGALDQELRAIDEAPVSEAGDVATIALPSPPSRGDRPPRVLTLRRRATDGKWFVDVLEFAGFADQDADPLEPGEADARIDLLYRLSRGLAEVADDCAAGRYRTAGDVRAAVQDRFHGAVQKSMEAMDSTRPSTRSSAGSVTQPER